MQALRRAVLAADRLTTRVAMGGACLALAVATAAGAWQVIARFLIETPSVWSEALVRTALVWMVLLGLAATIRQGALISIDVAHRLAGGATRRALEFLSLAATLLVLVVLFWHGWTMARRVSFQVMAGMEISIAWGYSAIPIGAAFAIIGTIAHFLDPRSTELETAV